MVLLNPGVRGSGSSLENLHLRSHVLVLLELLQERLLVVGPAIFFPRAPRTARAFLLRDVHPLELPRAVHASLPPLASLLLVTLLHQQHVRELDPVLVLLQLRVHDLQRREVVPERGVPGVQVVAQVRLGVQDDVVDSKVADPRNLHIRQEVLARPLFAHIHRLDVQHDVLRHHLRAAHGSVRGPVVLGRVHPDLPQCRHVSELERSTHSGDQHDWSHAAHAEGYLVR